MTLKLRSWLAILLCAAIALQLTVLLGMLVKSNWPLWFGQEIRVKTQPVDPRSLFRGNYARLGYSFSRLDRQQLAINDDEADSLRQGEVIYLSLAKSGDSPLYRPGKAYLRAPEEGLYIRGRLQNRRSPYRVNYGIEAWFAPKEKALALEADLRRGGVAVLMISDSGRATLKAVQAE